MQNPDQKTERIRSGRGDGRLSDGTFAKGNPGGPGRKRGSRNALDLRIRELVDEALAVLSSRSEKSAAQFLVDAYDDPKTRVAFFGLMGKCLVKDVRMEADGDVTIKVVTGIDPSLGEPGSN